MHRTWNRQPLKRGPPISKHQSNKATTSSCKEHHRKVRLKLRNRSSYSATTFLTLSQIVILTVMLSMVAANRPPRFLIEGQSEIVLRLKETPETKVGECLL